MSFGGEVIRSENRRLETFDVPQVKILVARKTEESAVAIANFGFAALRQVVAGADKARRPTMLEATVAAARRV